ncbi:MAG: hypothetical protein ACXV74_00370 [Methylobacter sp.]
MTKTQQDLSALPLTERLTASRPAAPVWFGGKKMSAKEADKLRAKAHAAGSIAGLSDHETIRILTLARKVQNATNQQTEYVSVGAGGELVVDENGNILGFCPFDSNGE